MNSQRIAALLDAQASQPDLEMDPIPDLTRAELVDAVGVCLSRDPDAQEFMVSFLRRSLPGVFDSDLIFYPFKDMGLEEIVDEIMLRRQIKDRGGQAALNAHYLEGARAVLQDPDAKPWSMDWAEGVVRRLG